MPDVVSITQTRARTNHRSEEAQTRTAAAEEGRAPTEKVDEKEKGRARAEVGAVVVDWDKMVVSSRCGATLFCVECA